MAIWGEVSTGSESLEGLGDLKQLRNQPQRRHGIDWIHQTVLSICLIVLTMLTMDLLKHPKLLMPLEPQ